MALGGLAALLRAMERVRERLNPELSLAGIVPCRVDLRTNLSRAIVQRLRERFADRVFDTPALARIVAIPQRLIVLLSIRLWLDPIFD
jgi:chromosome partitioning protein